MMVDVNQNATFSQHTHTHTHNMIFSSLLHIYSPHPSEAPLVKVEWKMEDGKDFSLFACDLTASAFCKFNEASTTKRDIYYAHRTHHYKSCDDRFTLKIDF